MGDCVISSLLDGVGESPTTGLDLIRDTSAKVDLIWRRLLMD